MLSTFALLATLAATAAAQDVICSKAGILPISAEACEPAYIQCVAVGIPAIRFECASDDTRYDVDTERCLEPEYVRACGGTPTTTTAAPQQDPTPKPFDFDCVGKPHLDFPNPNVPCSDLFVSCSGDEAHIRQCAAGTKFDIISRRCLADEFVKTCKGQSTTPAPEEDTTQADEDTRCAGRDDDVYEVEEGACSQAILACFGGVARQFLCPDGLKFDLVSKRCLQEQWVAACGGVSTTTASPLGPQADIDPTLLAFCAAKDDGNYASPIECSPMYITCSNGRPSLSQCPGDLVYSAADNECQRQREVSSCALFDASGNVCAGKANGFFAHPTDCNKFVFCDNKQPLELDCAGDLIFDPNHMKCDVAENVMGGCGAIREEDVPAFSCEGLPLGFHTNVHDCASYYLCEEDGSAWEFECQSGFAFDKTVEECRPAAQVGECMPPRRPDMTPFCRAQLRGGVFEDPTDCARGVICLQEVAFELNCGAAKPNFDRYLLQCVNTISAEAQCLQ